VAAGAVEVLVEAMLAQAVGAWVHTVVDIALKGLLTQAAVVVVVGTSVAYLTGVVQLVAPES
jgi:hypothetical protein